MKYSARVAPGPCGNEHQLVYAFTPEAGDPDASIWTAALPDPKLTLGTPASYDSDLSSASAQATRMAEPVDALPAGGAGPSLAFQTGLDEVRYRAETKTAGLEETMDRLDRFPQRFWGINE